jgi:hypothetical protein
MPGKCTGLFIGLQPQVVAGAVQCLAALAALRPLQAAGALVTLAARCYRLLDQPLQRGPGAIAASAQTRAVAQKWVVDVLEDACSAAWLHAVGLTLPSGCISHLLLQLHTPTLPAYLPCLVQVAVHPWAAVPSRVCYS